MSSGRFAEVFEAIDRKDAEGFVGFLTDDAVFAYGSQDPVAGRKSIQEYVAGFFGTLVGLSHEIEGIWEVDETAFVRGRVQYELSDGRQVAVPFLNLFAMNGDLIREYRVYIDPTPLAG